MTILSMREIWILAGVFVAYVLLISVRLQYGFSAKSKRVYRQGKHQIGSWAMSQTIGNKERQADMVDVVLSSAGAMAVVADGMGRENTGKLCAQIAIDTVLDGFEPYHTLSNPQYLFRTSFLEANSRIQKTIGDRRGGACLAAAYTDGAFLHYGLAGNIRIALLRNGELIPLSQGHTMDVLAVNAYQEGRLTKKETLWSLDEHRVWNYLGKTGFHEIEICEQPIKLKTGDIILMISCGIFQELSWSEMEDILVEDTTLQEKADCLVMAAGQKPGKDKENGSVLLLKAEVLDEKDQF